MGVCITYNTLPCSGKLPSAREEKVVSSPRRKSQQTLPVTQSGVSRGEDRAPLVIFRRGVSKNGLSDQLMLHHPLCEMASGGDWTTYKFMTETEGMRGENMSCHLSET